MTPYLTQLERTDLEAIGIDGWAFGYADRVRFHELDALQHVNNVAYLRWFETIRVAYIQAYGVTQYRPEDPQIVLRAQTADYFAPTHQNESYVVTARTTLVKASSFVMEYAAFVDGAARATGSAVLVSLTPDSTARQDLSAETVAQMIARDGAQKAQQ